MEWICNWRITKIFWEIQKLLLSPIFWIVNRIQIYHKYVIDNPNPKSDFGVGLSITIQSTKLSNNPDEQSSKTLAINLEKKRTAEHQLIAIMN